MSEDQQGPEVLIRLGHHEPKSIPTLDTLTSRAKGIIQNNSQGKVYFFVENAYFPQSASKEITKQVDDGLPASHMYYRIQYIHEFGKQPTIPELLKYMQKISNDPENQFQLEELQMITDLQKETRPTLKDKPRVGLVIESRPDDEVNNALTARRKLDEDFTELELQMFKGDFDRALPFFKSSRAYLANNSLVREKRIVQDIEAILGKKDTLAVIGTLGSVHTGVHQTLRKHGYNSRYEFLESELGQYIYDPGSGILRKYMIKGKETITDLQWYQAMIGSAIYNYLDRVTTLSPDPRYSRQDIVKISHVVTSQIKDMETVKRFEKDVKDKGFEEAVEDLFMKGPS